MRPRCYNRPPAPEGNWYGIGRRADGKLVMRWYPRFSVDRCATWQGVGIGQPTDEYPTGTPYPMAHGWNCDGCRWKPAEHQEVTQ